MTTENIEQRPGGMTGPVKKRGGMKVEAYVFYGISSFFVAAAVVYWVFSHESAGIVALLLTGVMLAMIATYLWFGSRRIEEPRPEDDPTAEVADGAGEVGWFPAASYWPFTLAVAIMFTGIAIAFWLVWMIVMGFAFIFLALAGWLFEFQRSHRFD